MFLADVEIQRYADAKISLALLAIRQKEGLRQGDFGGISERQVRRLEREESRLTAEAARHYAATLGCSLEEFLSTLGKQLSRLRDSDSRSKATEEVGSVYA